MAKSYQVQLAGQVSDLGCSGDMMALRLSRVMASMVNTEEGTEHREMNWFMEQ